MCNASKMRKVKCELCRVHSRQERNKESEHTTARRRVGSGRCSADYDELLYRLTIEILVQLTLGVAIFLLD